MKDGGIERLKGGAGRVTEYIIPCFLKSYIWQNLTFVYDFNFVAIGCFPRR